MRYGAMRYRAISSIVRWRGAVCGGLLASGLALAGVAFAGTAHAQTSRSASVYRQIGKSCENEVQRFCPELVSVQPQYRNWAICLRPYRASLSFGCRRAVKAAFS